MGGQLVTDRGDRDTILIQSARNGNYWDHTESERTDTYFPNHWKHTVSALVNMNAAGIIHAQGDTAALQQAQSYTGFYVKSSSANDTAAGTGARKIKAVYVNSSFEIKTQEVSMNGTSLGIQYS